MTPPTPEGPQRRPLSEISHLFLSNIREAAAGEEQRARPTRLPPGAPRPATPTPAPTTLADDADEPTRQRVTGLLGASATHPLTRDVARRYAAGCCADLAGRVALVWVAPGELAISLFERGGPTELTLDGPPDDLDDRTLAAALLELDRDVTRWVLAVEAAPAEQRQLLTACDDLALVTSCDHDGVVAGYRALKAHLASDDRRAPLALGLVGAPTQRAAETTWAKLAGVCRQFLDWPLAWEPPVDDAYPSVGEAAAVAWRGQPARNGRPVPQWDTLAEFLSLACAETDRRDRADASIDEAPPAAEKIERPTMTTTTTPAPMPTPTPMPAPSWPIPEPAALPYTPMPRAEARAVSPRPAPAPAHGHVPVVDEVLDLPNDDVVGALLGRAGAPLLRCPLQPPTCSGAAVAVARDRTLVLVADAARHDLAEVTRAWRWLAENRALVAMALPQLAIDGAAEPRLHLLADHARADGLRPLAGEAKAVVVQRYRTLTWGGRKGVLLDAA